MRRNHIFNLRRRYLIPVARRCHNVHGRVSKSYAMTGWRLGYLACPQNVADAIASFQSHSTPSGFT